MSNYYAVTSYKHYDAVMSSYAVTSHKVLFRKNYSRNCYTCLESLLKSTDAYRAAAADGSITKSTSLFLKYNTCLHTSQFSVFTKLWGFSVNDAAYCVHIEYVIQFTIHQTHVCLHSLPYLRSAVRTLVHDTIYYLH